MALNIVANKNDMTVSPPNGGIGSKSGVTTLTTAGDINAFMRVAFAGDHVMTGTLRGVVNIDLFDAAGNVAHQKTIRRLSQGPTPLSIKICLSLNPGSEGIVSEVETVPGEDYALEYEMNTTSFNEAAGTQKPRLEISYSGFFKTGSNGEALETGIFSFDPTNFTNRIDGSVYTLEGAGVAEVTWDFDVQDI